MELVLDSRKDLFKLFLIPRGHLKTSFLTIGYSVQTLVRDSNKRVLLANATWDNSRKFLKEIKDHSETQIFEDHFGKWKTPDSVWNTDEITIGTRTKVLKEASICTTGLEKEVTGHHYDTIICDDLVSKENITTPAQIQKVIDYYVSLIPILEPDGEMILIGTRWHKLDLYGHIIQKLKDQFLIYKRAIKENGIYIFPEKFNEAVDAKIKANTTSYFYSAQYYNEPISPKNQQFHKQYFKYYDDLPKDITVVNTTVDLSIGENHDSDDTAIVTVGWTPNSDLYILNIINDQWSSFEKMQKIYEQYRLLRPQTIGIESDAQQKYFKDLMNIFENLKNEPLPIVETKSGGKRKEDRIMNLEPLYRAGKVYHPRQAPWLDTLENQLFAFTPQGTHGKDDVIDALASQLQIYNGPLDLEALGNSWAIKNQDKEKDLNYYSNAVLWETESYNKQKALEEKRTEDEEWLFEIGGF